MNQTKRRRFLAILLAAVLLLSSGAASAPVSAASTVTDNATLVMSALGAISPDSSGNYNLSSTLTRAQFARMIVTVSSYEDLVNTTSTSSPFKDVPSNNWAAAYVRLAASNDLLIGYSDGSYKPNQAITLEQAVNGVLKLLGYTDDDFTGAFPYAQINTYKNIGLSLNISKGVGSTLTRGDGVNLLYNMMNAYVKDTTQKYAETLDYTLNDNDEIDYAAVVDANMYGPYTVKSSTWLSSLGISSSSPVIYRNGQQVDASAVKLYDILYYSASKATVWVYDDKITGIYEKASPSQDTVNTVTVSGTEYTLESSAAFSALSSSGTLKIGSGVTLLLGKNGGVADAVASTVVSDTAVLYVTETGSKTYTDNDGNTYTSTYIAGVTSDGNEIEYAISQDWVEVGDLVKVTLSSTGKLSVSTAKASLTGTVDDGLLSIGSYRVSENAFLIDTYAGRYTATSLNRIDGLTLDKSDVLYYEASGGYITCLVLNNVTGDSLQYGVVLSASTKNSSSSSLSGKSSTYTYDIGGITSTINVTGSLNASLGPALLYGSGDEVSVIRNLSSFSGKVSSVTSDSVTINGTIYPFAYDVIVYDKIDSNDYELATIEDAIAAGSAAKFYYDSLPQNGGRIRIIVI